MENRLNRLIREARNTREKIFCAYLTLGYPSVSSSIRWIKSFEEAGVDVLELGFPFSDPLADGPTIQRVAHEAIRKGVQFADCFRVMKTLRREGLEMPALLFSYFNPIFHFGVSRIPSELKDAGFDGAIVPDLPPEEGRDLETGFSRVNLSLVYLIAPTTSKIRMKEIAKHSDGFVYYVSLRGVTGARREISRDIRRNLRALRSVTDKTILAGFGVSNPSQAYQISKASDGVVVGSAILDRIRESGGRTQKVTHFVKKLVQAVKRAR